MAYVAAASKCFRQQQHTKPKEHSTKATGNDGSRCKFNTISMYTYNSQKVTNRSRCLLFSLLFWRMPTRQLVNIQIASIIFNFLILNTENNEGFQDESDSPHPLATTKEKYLWGLMKGRNYSCKIVDIRNVDDGRGRSAFAAKSFDAGDFVCEYRGVVRKKTDNDWGDERNASLGLGCFCYDVTYKNEAYVIDATASINDPGRYINHAAKNYNLITMPPVEIGKPPNTELRVGFVAKRAIKYGEELFFNYGIKPSEDFPWVSTDAKKVATTLQAITARYILSYHAKQLLI